MGLAPSKQLGFTVPVVSGVGSAGKLGLATPQRQVALRVSMQSGVGNAKKWGWHFRCKRRVGLATQKSGSGTSSVNAEWGWHRKKSEVGTWSVNAKWGWQRKEVGLALQV